MLDLSGYLLGVAEIGLLAGSAWLGATALRARLVPDLAGAPAHLATAVLTVASLLWAAELLGSFGLLDPVPYLLLVSAFGFGTWTLVRGWRGGRGAENGPGAPARRPPSPRDRTRGRALDVPAAVALAISGIAVVKFGLEAKPELSTGMTGFDSTWYHGPLAAGFFQDGDTWSLHRIAPQFLAWLYPANAEVPHAIGMLAFGRDVLSPLLNLGWLVGCLVACWCIGRPYRVAPWSLALGAIALSVPALSDQAGEARNDMAGTFFLLAAVAIALAQRERSSYPASGAALALGPAAVVGLAAGLAAGTKLNFLLPATVLVVGAGLAAPGGLRWRSFAAAWLAALAGGGYWYLRNLVHTGNPLPWITDLGPISLPGPEQALGGREGHSVLGYLTDGAVWADWFLPGLREGLTVLWPALLAAALAGLVLSLGRRADPALRVAGLAGMAAVLAWLVAPTSASGPGGMPRGFESGLRYLAPALVLGLAVAPIAPAARHLASALRSYLLPHSGKNHDRKGAQAPDPRIGRWRGVAAALVALLVVAVGYPVQRHYLEHRYADPSFATPGLDAAFGWAQGVADARIATTSTRQYPLFGRDLSNRVRFVGEEQPHGGFTAPATCPQWRRLLNRGDYDYVVASRDRMEPGKPAYPPSAAWTRGPWATVVLQVPPTAVYKLRDRLDPSGC